MQALKNGKHRTNPGLPIHQLLQVEEGTTLCLIAQGFRQVHKDHRQTVYTRSNSEGYQHRPKGEDYQNRTKEDHSDKAPMLNLRSRSRHKKAKWYPYPEHHWSNKSSQGITLVPKAQPAHHPGQEHSDVSAAETADSHFDIPVHQESHGFQPDWDRPSQERERILPDQPEGRNPNEEDLEEDAMPIPRPRPMDEDWTLSVKKAFDDPTRTKAPCEIPRDNQIVLQRTTSKKLFRSFQETLKAINKHTPTMVIENMASIFAQSGKMNIA